MSNLYSMQLPDAGVTIAANTTVSVASLATAATRQLQLYKFALYGRSSTSTDVNAEVRVNETTNAGTGTAGTEVAVIRTNGVSATVTGLVDLTVEPTSPTRIDTVFFHPAAGCVQEYGPGEEPTIAVSKFMGLSVTNPSGNASLVVRGCIWWREV